MDGQIQRCLNTPFFSTFGVHAYREIRDLVALAILSQHFSLIRLSSAPQLLENLFGGNIYMPSYIARRREHRQHSDLNFTLCDDYQKEHSGASRACTWLSLLRLDINSASRQPHQLMVNLARTHLLPANGRRRRTPWPNDKMKLASARLLKVRRTATPSTRQCDLAF